MSFEDIGLDPRLTQALTTIGVTEPTDVQQAAIPLALNDRKDVIATARTGSGKTLAYLLPILQIMLDDSDSDGYALIIVPSRELADQIYRVLVDITKFAKEVNFVNIAPKLASDVRATLLQTPHKIVVATPSSALEQLEAQNLGFKNLSQIVFDEADLLSAYGYKQDLDQLRQLLESSRPQVWLMGATLGEDVQELKAEWCRKPVTVNVESASDENLKQYFCECSEIDKFLLIYVILKLGLIQGKTLVFTNEIDRAYRLRLFLEQFGIKAAVLNSELPQESRVHIVQQFDRNIYNLLIATDEPNQSSESRDYGVSRGVDFKNVSCVLNFDLPQSSKAYTHRVGRTARANQKGMALSFVVPKSEFGKHKIASCKSCKRDEKVLARVRRKIEVHPYKFDMQQIDSFRYRMEDAFRAVTKSAVREARVKELKQEIVASTQLQRHFEENPDDLAALRHDADLHLVRNNRELKNVPAYLLPNTAARPQVLLHAPVKSKFNQRRDKKRTKARRGSRNPLKFGR